MQYVFDRSIIFTVQRVKLLNEISISRDINISNLGQTTNAETKLTRRSSDQTKSLVNGCSSQIVLRIYQGSILTASVVAELELNSVIPPPDTVEEEKQSLKDSLKLITYRRAAPG